MVWFKFMNLLWHYPVSSLSSLVNGRSSDNNLFHHQNQISIPTRFTSFKSIQKTQRIRIFTLISWTDLQEESNNKERRRDFWGKKEHRGRERRPIPSKHVWGFYGFQKPYIRPRFSCFIIFLIYFFLVFF